MNPDQYIDKVVQDAEEIPIELRADYYRRAMRTLVRMVCEQLVTEVKAYLHGKLATVRAG